MKLDQTIRDFVEQYVTAIRSDAAAVFAGAGLSKQAGFVDWAGLLQPIATSLGLDSGKESTDLVALAQYHLNESRDNRFRLNQLLIDNFADAASPTENHLLLARLPIQTFWTTNYDRLIENALEGGGKRVDVKYAVQQLGTTRRGRDAVVYKMHGDIEHPAQAVLSRDDYERYHLTHHPFIAALSGDLVTKTFFFVEFSFTDPNLNFILSRIRTTFDSRNLRQHYCVLKRRSRLEGESDTDFDYAVRKQGLVAGDLLRFNIVTIYVDEYSDITGLLDVIEKRARRKTVLISGSAADYGPWGVKATESFLSTVTAALIDRDMTVATGFGIGIGGGVVSGALQQIYSTRRRSIAEQLVLRPFPIGIADPVKRRETFTRYRKDLVAQAGIGIFIMGNKIKDNKLVPASGVAEEYALARQSGLFVVPIGASGGVSRDLWKTTVSDVSEIFPGIEAEVTPLLMLLGETTNRPEDLVAPLLKLVELLSD